MHYFNSFCRYTPTLDEEGADTQEGLQTNGWKVYSMKREFERQGVLEKNKIFRIQQCWETTDGNNI